MLEVRLGMLKSYLRPEHEQVRQAESELAALTSRIGQIPAMQNDLVRLYRDTKLREQLLMLLTAELEQARIQGVHEHADARGARRRGAAGTPRASAPPHARRRGGLLLAFVFSSAWYVLRERDLLGRMSETRHAAAVWGGRSPATRCSAGSGRFVSVLGWTLLAPWMLHTLGAERFRLWSLLSVFSSLALTFDLGLQGAHEVRRGAARGRRHGGRARPEDGVRVLLGMGLALYLLLGAILLAAAAWLQTPLLDFFKLSGAIRADAGVALVIAAAATLALNLSQ